MDFSRNTLSDIFYDIASNRTVFAIRPERLEIIIPKIVNGMQEIGEATGIPLNPDLASYERQAGHTAAFKDGVHKLTSLVWDEIQRRDPPPSSNPDYAREVLATLWRTGACAVCNDLSEPAPPIWQPVMQSA